VNKWGDESHRQRATCDTRLNQIGDIVLQIKDHSVIKGHRNQEDQHQAFVDGHSKLDWPDGNHNAYPSKAQDVMTYPWPEKESDQREEQLYLLGLYRGVAHMKGIKLRTGADWDRDGEIADNGFDDFFHVEIDE
jgi:peptidoglycan L-alanyl-D-glutamate endopeptidase CwlK